MRTVLYIIDTLEIGGAEKSLLEILPNFKKFRPIICSIYEGNHLKSTFEARGIVVYSLNINQKYAFKKAISFLLDIIRFENVDLLHSTLFRSDIIGRKLHHTTRLPLINSFVNNSYAKERYARLPFISKIKLFYYQLRDRFTASKVNLFISNSETIKLSNSKALGIPLHKIKVIYRGRPIHHYYQSDELSDRKYKEALSLDSSFVFINVSRIIPRKGQTDIIKAFQFSGKLKKNAKLLIVGDGEYRNELESLVNQYDLQDHVMFLGNRTDIPGLLSMADAFVFPSYYEGLPGALVEAMLAKKIIIASSISENHECVTKDNALLFEKGDIIMLAQHMEAVMQNKAAYQHLAEKAQQEARTKFDIDLIVPQYEEVYKQVLGTV